MSLYRSLQATSDGSKPVEIVELPEKSLEAQQVKVEVRYSSLNYKDALAVTGRGKILRQSPLVPGIDFAGEVVDSDHPSFQVGDPVIANGCGLGEFVDGGYAEQVVVDGDNVLHLPEDMALRDAMIIGTAGFTAGLCLERMGLNGQVPEMGSIVVTGASGGVGTLATKIFHSVGYEVIAVTEKSERREFLKRHGASQVMNLSELALGQKPLESVRFGGAVDSLGGEVLSGLLAATALWGNVASIGLALDAKFSTTVMPHILRGVNLLGISSNNCPMDLREHVWTQIAAVFEAGELDDLVSNEIGLEDILPAAEAMLNRRTSGRILVRIDAAKSLAH